MILPLTNEVVSNKLICLADNNINRYTSAVLIVQSVNDLCFRDGAAHEKQIDILLPAKFLYPPYFLLTCTCAKFSRTETCSTVLSFNLVVPEFAFPHLDRCVYHATASVKGLLFPAYLRVYSQLFFFRQLTTKCYSAF